MKCERCGLEYQPSACEQVEPAHPMIDCAKRLVEQRDRARAKAIEECAKVAEAELDGGNDPYCCDVIAERIAENIRELKNDKLAKHKETCTGCCGDCGGHCPEDGGTECGWTPADET